MSQYGLLFPMFALVVLSFAVIMLLFRSRTRAVAEGKVSAGYFKTYQQGKEPDSSILLSRHLINLFETPMLFYVACLAGMVLEQVTVAMLILAWLYVALRYLHAFIHLGSNKLRPRIALYFLSIVVMLLMWVYLVAGVLLR